MFLPAESHARKLTQSLLSGLTGPKIYSGTSQPIDVTTKLSLKFSRSIFARSDRIHPESDALKKVGKVFHRELPSTEAVCRSAVVALLFLLRGYLHLTAPDLYYLMLESLGHQDAHTGAQLLCDLSEGRSGTVPDKSRS